LMRADTFLGLSEHIRRRLFCKKIRLVCGGHVVLLIFGKPSR
jgi:hypothetical protein